MKSSSAAWIAGVTFLAWAGCKDEGVLYLTSVNEEPPGANCADGGSKLDFGADGDADGQLATTEITASSYVCNGAASRGATVTSTALQPGDDACPEGGYVLSIGVDRNGDGAIDANEGTTRTICNGESGVAGPSGSDGGYGPAGPEGPEGPAGSQGPVGDAGAPGPAGEMGPQGDAGPAGPQGEPGPQGDAGVPGSSSLITATPEPISENCMDPGVRIDVGLDNGDGGGIANDGTLQDGEIDDTEFACTRRPRFINGSFETGDLTGWITQDLESPFRVLEVTDLPATPGDFGGDINGANSDGAFGLVTGFDGNGTPETPIFVAQDIDLRGFTSIGVSFDWSVPFCDLGPYGATLPRVFSMVVESDDGTELLTEDLFTCAPGTFSSQALVDDEFIDISTVADQLVRIKFRWSVPEQFTGPAEAHLDDVELLILP